MCINGNADCWGCKCIKDIQKAQMLDVNFCTVTFFTSQKSSDCWRLRGLCIIYHMQKKWGGGCFVGHKSGPFYMLFV